MTIKPGRDVRQGSADWEKGRGARLRLSAFNLLTATIQMNESVLQIEARISKLPREEQLWLVERIIHTLRESERHAYAAWIVSLDEMANDPDIQRENRAIERDFAFCKTN
jgi:hypothetical protein